MMKDIIPTNIEAEEAILGGILLDPEAMSRVAEVLVKEAFSLQAHQEIYNTAKILHSQGKPTDLIAVSTYLADRELLEKVGGTTKLGQLLNRTVSAVNIDRYTDLVMDKYIRRQLISAGHEIVDLGYDTREELEVVLDRSEQKVFRLTQSKTQEGLVPISDSLVNAFNQIEKLHQKTAIPGIPSGYYDLDGITNGFSRSDLIILAARPSMGKCLEANSEIVCSDGSIATIEEIYHRRNCNILTLENNGEFSFTQPSNFINDGIKPVYRVTTRLGKCIETTLSHPYLTIRGWRKLEQLKSGDKIAVPSQINIFGTKNLSIDRVKLLAYLISDRCFITDYPEFNSNNILLQQEFSQCIANFNKKNQKNNKSNTLTIWLRELNISRQDSQTKIIPNIIFTLKRSLVSLFLNRLFGTSDISIVLKNNRSIITYSTVREKLARQIQHLLLRFGIIASLKIDRNSNWQIYISDRDSLKIFITEIGIFTKERELTSIDLSLQKSLLNKIYSDNKHSTTREISLPINKSLLTKQTSIAPKKLLSTKKIFNQQPNTIYWDEIIAIEFIGNKQVYDLTIPKTHNFVANDICVHNTALALCIALNVAKEQDLPVAIFSLEMSREQLAQRLLSSEARIPSNRLRGGNFSQNEYEPLVNAVTSLSELPIFIDDSANLSVLQMRSQVRKLQGQSKKELGLVLLDYLQLMEGSGSDNRVQELSKITRSLKGLARELNVPIIALSQLSRGVEQRNNKRPMLSDLRESGSIEQDADLVIMLYREEYYNPDTPDRGIAEAIIVKHRNGPVGTVKLLFKGEFTKFESLANRGNY